MVFAYFLVVICLLLTASSSPTDEPPSACLRFLQTVPIPIRIRLWFGGRTPLFMRVKGWDLPSLPAHLNSIAASADWRNRSTLLSAFGCPVVHTRVSYTAEILPHASTRALDASLKAAMQRAGDRRLPAEALAGMLAAHVPDRRASEREERAYDVLIYSPVFASSEADYGYFAQADGRLGSVGVSNARRFLFLDVSARPFAFEAGTEPAAGEILFTVSRSMAAYAEELHRFLMNALVPPLGRDGAVLLKNAKTIHFVTVIVDANEIVVQEELVGGAAHSRHPPGSTFDQSRFEKLVRSVSKSYFDEEGYNVTFATASLANEDALSLAMTRSVDFSASEIGVRETDLLPDIVSVATQFKSPSESVLVVPIFVLSFADLRRKIHFQDASQAYSHPDSPVIMSLENRLETGTSAPSDITLHSARKALEHVFGLNSTTLALPGTTDDSFSRTVLDVSERHFIAEKLRSSAGSSLEKAMSALNYSGYDNIARGHLKTKSISRLRHSVVLKLSSVMRECRHWVRSGRTDHLGYLVSDLLAATQTLSDTMITVVCKKMMSDDIVRDVQAAKSRFSPLSSFLVALVGFCFGFSGLEIISSVFKRNPPAVLPQQSLTPSASDTSTKWFSTLQWSGSKSKRN